MPMSLLEEAIATQAQRLGRSNGPCGLAQKVAALKEAKEFEALFANDAVNHMTILELLKRRHILTSDKAVRRHRIHQCSCYVSH